MPTYEFKCPNGHVFDKFYRSIGDSQSEIPCPECGETAVRQISGGAGLLFKGSGFYLTDYGKNAHRTGGDSKPSGESKSSGGASKSETKSDSKPSGDAGSKPASSSGGDKA